MLITRGELGRIVREEAARLQEASKKGRTPESEWERLLAAAVDAAMKDVGFLSQGEKAAAADELERKLVSAVRTFISEQQAVEDEDAAYGRHMDREARRPPSRVKR